MLNCVLTGSKKFKKLISIKKFPTFLGVVEKKFKSEFLDLNFWINKDSGTVQIYPRVPIHKLYFKSHGSGSIGQVWKNHHKLFLDLIFKYTKGNIIEIGGGHNSISIANKIKKNYDIKIITFDPNSSLKKKIKNTRIVKNFFSRKRLVDNKIKPKSIDLVVHSHLAEHIYDLRSFFLLINDYLSKDGHHIFSIPNMEAMIKQGFANTVNFEHPFYLNEILVDELLYITGFEILKKKYYKKDHSIFYVTKKNYSRKSSFNNKKFYRKMFLQNYKIFSKFYSLWKKDVNNINKFLGTNKKYYLFGAHIFSQFLIKFGLRLDNVLGILDNDTRKQNLYLYGTKIKVFSPNILKNKRSPLVIIRAAQYSQEIKKQILNKINSSTKFI
jgi:2-polyprenyl-3-methyl-5-hydroxy-6-metoxy-1,4-benzoquinol methylase